MMADACYLCGGSDFIRVEGKVRDVPDLKILRCSACGLVFLENFDHVDDKFYEDSQMRSDRDIIDWDVYIEKTKLDDTRRFEWIKPKLPQKSVLDFGCGAGGFLAQIKGVAASCAGVEKDKALQRVIEQKLGITVYGDMTEMDQNYDLITLFHVLEHFKDPKALLTALAVSLTDKGRIVIEVPNADDALLTKYKSKAFSEFTYWGCHLYLFNNTNLTSLVESAGLFVDEIRQIQRYPLSNHLYWLANGKPGGHEVWADLNGDDLHQAYEAALAGQGICDTIIATIRRPE